MLSAKLVNKFVDHTCDGRRAVAISYTSADHNALSLTALLRFLVDLLYNLFSPPGFWASRKPKVGYYVSLVFQKLFLVISFRPNISTSTGPIFTKFAGMVILCTHFFRHSDQCVQEAQLSPSDRAMRLVSI